MVSVIDLVRAARSRAKKQREKATVPEEKPQEQPQPQPTPIKQEPAQDPLLNAPKDPSVIEGGAIPVGDRLVLGEKDPSKIADIRAREGIGLQQQQAERVLLPEQQEQARRFAEDAGLFEDQPAKVDLGGVGPIAQNLPIVGPSLQALFNKIQGSRTEDPKVQELAQTPQGRIELMRTEIEKQQIKKVDKSISRIGVVAEGLGLTSLPLGIGEAVERFVRTPKEDVDTLVEELGELESTMSSMTDSVAQGEMGNPFQAIKKIEESERQILEIQVQIQLLKNYSAELQSDPKELELIEAKIDKALLTTFEAKQRAGEGAFVTPTEESLYFKLQQLR